MEKGQPDMLSMIFSTCPSLLLLTHIPHKVCLASKEAMLSTNSSTDVEISSPVKTPEPSARGILRSWLAAGNGRGQGPGTSSKVQALRVMGFFAFLSPQQNPYPGISFDMTRCTVRLKTQKKNTNGAEKSHG